MQVGGCRVGVRASMARTGRLRLSAGNTPGSLGRCHGLRRLQRWGDPHLRVLFAVVEDWRVDAQQDIDAVPCPFGHLGRRDAGAQPQRDRCMPEVVGATSKWGGDLLWGKGGTSSQCPDSVDGAHRHWRPVGTCERPPSLPSAGHEEAAIDPRWVVGNVMSQRLHQLRCGRDWPRLPGSPVLQVTVWLGLTRVSPMSTYGGRRADQGQFLLQALVIEAVVAVLLIVLLHVTNVSAQAQGSMLFVVLFSLLVVLLVWFGVKTSRLKRSSDSPATKT
jgi:hypothetical protein